MPSRGNGSFPLGGKVFLDLDLFFIRLAPVFGLHAAVSPPAALLEFDVIRAVLALIDRSHGHPRNAGPGQNVLTPVLTPGRVEKAAGHDRPAVIGQNWWAVQDSNL